MPEKQYTKLDNHTLQITEQVTPPVQVSTYVYDDLVSAVTTLQTQKTVFNTDIDQKIADAQALVTEADNLGIVSTQTN